MLDLHLTRHGAVRMRQRGFRPSDLDLVLDVATQAAEDAYILTNQDADREIAKRKAEIQQLERLRGSKFIIEGGALITLYHGASSKNRSGYNKSRRAA